MDTTTARLRERLQATLGGAYTLERELGGGGMSRVFVAEDARLRRRVVVKVLHPELAAGLSAARFEREIRVSARLQHPHLVPVHAAGESTGCRTTRCPTLTARACASASGARGRCRSPTRCG